MIEPKPIPIVICEVCRQPWDDHLYMVWDEEQPVTLEQCVVLLKRANQGPPGPPGPIGPMGMTR